MSIKLRKRKKREQQNRRQRLAEEQRRRERGRQRLYRLTYPEFHCNAKHGDAKFVQVVKEALATISFEDRSIFAPWEQELYRTLKRVGLGGFRVQLKVACEEAGLPDGQMAEIYFICNLGQAVINRISEATREIFLPFNDVMFIPHGHRIEVIFRSLLKAKGPSGTVYYSRRRPTLDIDGVSKVVAFSKHAIERTCQRIRPRWKTSYAALGDVFAYFEQCRYFERCELCNGQLAFTFYDQCAKGFAQAQYVDDVLGESNFDPRAGKPYYRVGYCPAVLEGDFVKATTLLFPGYRGTPEYGAILRATLPTRKEMIAKANGLDAETLYDSRDFSLIKWFHEHGVPQVVLLDRPVFAPVV